MPGILIIALGRSTAAQSRSASWIVRGGVVGQRRATPRARPGRRARRCAGAGRRTRRTRRARPPPRAPRRSPPAVRALAAEPADVVVVGAAARDRLLEDRGVRGHAPEAVLPDQPGQLARGDQVAGDVVVPGALPQLAESHQRIHDALAPARCVPARQQLAHHLGRALGRELELLEQPLAGRGGAEALHGRAWRRRRWSSAASRTATPPRSPAGPGRTAAAPRCGRPRAAPRTAPTTAWTRRAPAPGRPGAAARRPGRRAARSRWR